MAGVLALACTCGVATPPAFASPARPALFRVGAALEPINPTEKVYLGGYQSGPPGGTILRHTNPLTGRRESLTVRAIAIASGSRVIELESIDGQGSFASYQEGPYGLSDIRAAGAAYLRAHGYPQATAADIIVSTLHEHAVPSLYGIYSPYGFNTRYLVQVYHESVHALELAAARAVPATITVGRADAPWLGGGDVAEGNSFEGWLRDGSLAALWARSARTGATIATYVFEPAYPNIVDGDEDLIGTNHTLTLISTDFPSYAEAALERRLGGIAILASGSLANQTSPFQADQAPSPDLPRVHGYQQDRAFDDIIVMGDVIANVTFGALAHAKPLTSSALAAAERYVLSPITNPAVSLIAYGNAVDQGAPWAPIAKLTNIYPADRSVSPPYLVGDALGTWVTALRVGDTAIVSEPGEFFGSIHQAWEDGIHAPGGVFVVGNAQDYLGYEFPADVTPFTAYGGDELIFNPSPALGDQVVAAGLQDAAALGFATNPISNAELAALDQDYAKVLDPGAYFLPTAISGDLSPRRHAFRVELDPIGSPPRSDMLCDNPALLYNPGSCPASDPPVGPFHFDFGDGTTASYPPVARVKAAVVGPFVRHTYRRAGDYPITLTVVSAGRSNTMTLSVAVHPALRVGIVRHGGFDLARVSGGDGRVVLLAWRLPGGRIVCGSRVAAALRPLTVTVVDGTGTSATARAR
jgi:hypothetical protein